MKIKYYVIICVIIIIFLLFFLYFKREKFNLLVMTPEDSEWQSDLTYPGRYPNDDYLAEYGSEIKVICDKNNERSNKLYNCLNNCPPNLFGNCPHCYSRFYNRQSCGKVCKNLC